MSDYQDARWQRKRLEAMQAYGWTCQKCGSKGVGENLHVHHRRYPRHAKVWEVDTDNLTVLCELCHEQVTLLKREIGAWLHDERAFKTFREVYYATRLELAVEWGDDEGPPPLQQIYNLAKSINDDFKVASECA